MGFTTKLHHALPDGWQRSLGEKIESPLVSGIVILLICVDLSCTVLNVLVEETNSLNATYDKEEREHIAELTHNICVTVLVIFLIEQILHIVAFGKAFFSHPWYVLDLIVVSVSLICETVLEGMAEEFVPMLIMLRLWKVGAFVFDVFLARNEQSEMAEKLEADKKDSDYGSTAKTEA